MRGRAQSRSRQRSPSTNQIVTAKSLGMTMKLPLISNGYAEEPQNPVWSGPKPSLSPVVGVCSQQGKRPYQEDEYCIRQNLNKADAPETHFFGLFDGHAGGKCSHHVANHLANTLLEDESFGTNLPQAIKRSFYTCNEQFLKIAEKMKLHDGSTGIVSLIRDNKLLVANAGDCRAVVVNRGRPVPMSNDHKPTVPEEQKRIAALGGTVVYCMGVARVNRVLAVSRAFGNRTLRAVIRPDAELSQRELVEGDEFLVMASDGLWDVLKNKDVCDVCYYPTLQRRPQAIAEELVNLALSRGSMDNVTCIVVNLSEFRQSNGSGSNNHSNSDDLNRAFLADSNHFENSLNYGNLTAGRSIISMTDDENEGYNIGGGQNVASMIMNRKNSNSNVASQNRVQLVKSGSTSTLSNLADGNPSFPAVGGMSSSNQNNNDNTTGKLFTASDGAVGIGSKLPSTSKLLVRQGSLNTAEASHAFKNGFPSADRRNSRLGSAKGGNNNSDHAAPISRASLNDLSNMISEFGLNNSF